MTKTPRSVGNSQARDDDGMASATAGRSRTFSSRKGHFDDSAAPLAEALEDRAKLQRR